MSQAAHQFPKGLDVRAAATRWFHQNELRRRTDRTSVLRSSDFAFLSAADRSRRSLVQASALEAPMQNQCHALEAETWLCLRHETMLRNYSRVRAELVCVPPVHPNRKPP